MGKFTEYNLPLSSLVKGTHEFEYHLGKKFFSDMENTDIHDADLTVKLTVRYDGRRYDVSFTVSGEVVLICDRCLDDLHYPVDSSYSISVEYGDDFNDETDGLLVIPGSERSLNMAYMIYDTVALAIPMKHVHPMGKCNRQMSALLRKHRARPADSDDELENELIDEIDNIDSAPDTPADPRWNALKDFNAGE